jgi:peptidoglycan hydrolase CwlO-like protein
MERNRAAKERQNHERRIYFRSRTARLYNSIQVNTNSIERIKEKIHNHKKEIKLFYREIRKLKHAIEDDIDHIAHEIKVLPSRNQAIQNRKLRRLQNNNRNHNNYY